jgi:HPt (histidine-containing phosphotransfer) domain-containing protein
MAPNASHASSASTRPIISRFADDPDMLESIRFFTAELRDCVAIINEAFGSGDLKTVRQIAKQLRGAAAGFGFPELTQAASDLLDNWSDAPALAQQIGRLTSLSNRVIAGCGADGA